MSPAGAGSEATGMVIAQQGNKFPSCVFLRAYPFAILYFVRSVSTSANAGGAIGTVGAIKAS